MKLFQILQVTDRSVTLELLKDTPYFSPMEVEIWEGEQQVAREGKNIFSIYGLDSDKAYCWRGKVGEETEEISFRTKKYPYIFRTSHLAGKADATEELQLALDTLPKGSLVEFTEGHYYVTALFLREGIDVCFNSRAVLHGIGTRETLPVLPLGYEGDTFYSVSTWEGESNESFCALINSIGQKDICIFGQGTIDGGANFDNWWKNPKEKDIAYRPKLVSIIQSSHIQLLDITLQNSPSWTIHPLCSHHLSFTGLQIINPPDSPNTDGLNPEFCQDVTVKGVYISVGDDCIAIKSGKRELASKVKQGTSHITVENCHMENGHGGVVLGSEMSGGIGDISIKNCIFKNTDRGIRVKTRRGRGKYGIIDNITVDNVSMYRVNTPLVINCYYFCDADGKSDYVQNRNPQKVDERTPEIKHLQFRRLDCKEITVCGMFIMGLPEQPIECVHIADSRFSFSKEEKFDYPAMLCNQEKLSQQGAVLKNIREVRVENTIFDGYKGVFGDMENVENLIMNIKGEEYQYL